MSAAPYIICKSCGTSLGDKYDAFILLKEMKCKSSDYKLRKTIDITLGEELDMLGLNMLCCRANMLTQSGIQDKF